MINEDATPTLPQSAWQSCWFAGMVLVVLVHAVWFMISLSYWGSGQVITPEIVEKKLKLGMTPSQCEYALAVPPGSIVEQSSLRSDRITRVHLCESGIGSWFVPQYEITLVFDSRGKLDKCDAEIHWRCDEQYLRLHLTQME